MSFRAAFGSWLGMLAVLLGVSIWRAPHIRDGFYRPPAPRIALVDDRGAAFSLPRASHRVVILAFGYTRCGDECPLVLARLAALFRAHAAWRGGALVAFVTVDPAHDTAPVLRRYLAHFGSSFVGVTGPSARVRDALRAYAVESDDARDDPRLHAATISVIDRRGRVAGVVDPNVNDSVLARLIERVVREPV
jgi:cytochrome oxidase Cu insertion factor (SCO1/SenC/PrrC family)